MSECKHKFISTNRIFCTHCEFEPSDDYVLLLKQLKEAQADIQTQKANLLSQGRLLVEAREEVERLKESLKIDIGDLVMIDDEPQFVSAIVSDPVLKVYYWLDNQELSVTADEIDCHFVNMNRVNEPKQ